MSVCVCLILFQRIIEFIFSQSPPRCSTAWVLVCTVVTELNNSSSSRPGYIQQQQQQWVVCAPRCMCRQIYHDMKIIYSNKNDGDTKRGKGGCGEVVHTGLFFIMSDLTWCVVYCCSLFFILSFLCFLNLLLRFRKILSAYRSENNK